MGDRPFSVLSEPEGPAPKADAFCHSREGFSREPRGATKDENYSPPRDGRCERYRKDWTRLLTHEGLSSLHPLPRWGEGKVNLKFNSLALLGERGERLISVHEGG